jgi:hypothetical protein
MTIKDRIKQAGLSVTNREGTALVGETNQISRNDVNTGDLVTGALLDFFDLKPSYANPVAVRGLNPINTQSLDTAVFPDAILVQLGTSMPMRVTTVPIQSTIDASGIVTSGGFATVAGGRQNFGGTPGPVIGYVFQVKSGDTLNGLTQINPIVGNVNLVLQLEDTDGTGWVCIINTRAGNKNTFAGTSVAAAPNITTTVGNTVAALVDEQFFDFSNTVSASLGGSNAQVVTYPLILTPALYSVIMEALIADEMQDLASVILAQFLSDLNA